MLRFALAALVLIFVTFVPPATAGELRRELLSSRALGRDLPFLVYVPDGYDTPNSTRSFTCYTERVTTRTPGPRVASFSRRPIS